MNITRENIGEAMSAALARSAQPDDLLDLTTVNDMQKRLVPRGEVLPHADAIEALERALAARIEAGTGSLARALHARFQRATIARR